MTARQISTRFRAYQLDEAGASFSLAANGHMTVIEARVTDLSRPHLIAEVNHFGNGRIDTLHITSWDTDHCNLGDLEWMIRTLQPRTIEYPGYTPHSDTAREALSVIQSEYRRPGRGNTLPALAIRRIDPEYIGRLVAAENLAYQDVFYHPRSIMEGSNDNSTVKVFRRGMFNVASLGDVEHPNLSAGLRRCKIFQDEIDVLLLAHHGSDSALNSKTFLEKVMPRVAICASNYDNHHDHPRQVVRDTLHELGIAIFTTKTGDVIIESLPQHNQQFRVTNMRAGNTEVSSQRTYTSKKARLLAMNSDTLRNRVQPGYRGV
jgi:competence protein ComEC